jgi:metal-sulfur cluster biosynthetic enzyme
LPSHAWDPLSRIPGAQTPEGAASAARPLPGGYVRVYTGRMVDREEIVNALHTVEDPELGMDIVELGLFYDVEIDGPKVKVIHTLTSMGCPAGQMIQEDIQNATSGVEGVEEVEVELTFDPPWTPDKMSDDAKFILGFG